MQRWEYKTVYRSREFQHKAKGYEWNEAGAWTTLLDDKQYADLDQVINLLGNDGWELVAITPRSKYLGASGSYALDQGSRDFAGFTNEEVWVFKRPKP